MFVLKKRYFNYRVKGSTLMETLVATVLIVVVFMVASTILNTLFSNTIKTNTRNIEATLNEIQYLYTTKKIELPFTEVYNAWQVTAEFFIENTQKTIIFEAVNSKTKQTITKQLFEAQ